MAHSSQHPTPPNTLGDTNPASGPSETMVLRFHSLQSIRAVIEHEAPLYYSLRDGAGNPLIVSKDRVREIVPLADIDPCPNSFSGADTDPGHRWDGGACALCGKARMEPVPVEDAVAAIAKRSPGGAR
ncbi:hypothetical protein [Streptomyces sp. A0592]|uniref:hypothetical protein n=1 Tax=Streptomyces sp. A0592 TaxID=2563099 RepID=UPI00109E7411|nr:hypothetical protein [Streptomyces sp. A0592]THA82744.1 hypothetical protein E6U81_19570 [Streptomyces sp. A0592]